MKFNASKISKVFSIVMVTTNTFKLQKITCRNLRFLFLFLKLFVINYINFIVFNFPYFYSFVTETDLTKKTCYMNETHSIKSLQTVSILIN